MSQSFEGIKSFLLDINGVLFNSGEDHAIEGSVEAMHELVRRGCKYCLVTNECTTARPMLAEKLRNFGFDMVQASDIISPAPVACKYLEENPHLVPLFHAWDGILEEFNSVKDRINQEGRQANCLVVGDAMTNVSRDYVDNILDRLLRSCESVQIITLGTGRYYKDGQKLRMDTGAYAAAYEYCLGAKATNVGKPRSEFFSMALSNLNAQPSEAVMIGDDVVSDVGGAQALGIRGVLVRTGKYQKIDETGRGVRPDGVFDNLRQFVASIK